MFRKFLCLLTPSCIASFAYLQGRYKFEKCIEVIIYIINLSLVIFCSFKKLISEEK